MEVNGDAESPPAFTVLEMGLTREQYEAIPAYTAAHSLCPTCHQKLNTNVPTLEEVEAMPMPRETI